MDWLPAVIGHRGAAGLAPENTLGSFALAADLGCRMVEFDVRLSADGVPVVFHDDDLERCTGETGAVAGHGADALRRLGIPTLAEVLGLCAGRAMAVNIELKPHPGAGAVTARAALEQAGALWPTDCPPPLISSFRKSALSMAVEVAPHWPRGLLAQRLPPHWRQSAASFGCTALHLDHRWLSVERVAMIRAEGLSVLAYTVNRRGRAEKLWFRGVSAVFSDRPDLLTPPSVHMS